MIVYKKLIQKSKLINKLKIKQTHKKIQSNSKKNNLKGTFQHLRHNLSKIIVFNNNNN